MFTHKKVSLMELFYDLVFVYAISQTSSLLEGVSAGRFEWDVLLRFGLTFVVVLNAWFLQAVYNNRFYQDGPLEYAFHLWDMTLVLMLAKTSLNPLQGVWNIFGITLAMLSISLSLRYGIRWWQAHDTATKQTAGIYSLILLVKAAIIMVAVFLPYEQGLWGLGLGVLVGWLAPGAFLRRFQERPVDFSLLMERVSLLVILYFGEMLVRTATSLSFGYRSDYLAFAVIAMLFLQYKLQLDRYMDANVETAGGRFIYSHYPLLLGLSGLTAALVGWLSPFPSFALPLVAYPSLLLFYLGLGLLDAYNKPVYGRRSTLWLYVLAIGLAFALSYSSHWIEEFQLFILATVNAVLLLGRYALHRRKEGRGQS